MFIWSNRKNTLCTVCVVEKKYGRFIGDVEVEVQ